MDKNLPKIYPSEEEKKISDFLKKTFSDQKIKRAVIGISGGIDSSTSLALLSKSIPKEKILILHLPFFETEEEDIEELLKTLKISEEQLIVFSIQDMVDEITDELEIEENDLVRRGNIMARVRMIVLYDFAKKYNALVIGTENRSEFHLGYFTRYGDEASDVEPIQHLYKTQVYELARHLSVPSSILQKKPSANLWEAQTDEGEFGFSYSEADPVLYRFFDKQEPIQEILKDFPNARRIIDFAKKNSYKHKVPYVLASD